MGYAMPWPGPRPLPEVYDEFLDEFILGDELGATRAAQRGYHLAMGLGPSHDVYVSACPPRGLASSRSGGVLGRGGGVHAPAGRTPDQHTRFGLYQTPALSLF